MTIAAEFGTGQVLWSILWFFLFFLFFFLVITVFLDIMRNRDLSGWGKALWAVGIIILPFLGIFMYLIVNGSDMNRRADEDARSTEEARQAYIRDATAADPGEELSKLADMHSAGQLTDAEYEQAKARAVRA